MIRREGGGRLRKTSMERLWSWHYFVFLLLKLLFLRSDLNAEEEIKEGGERENQQLEKESQSSTFWNLGRWGIGLVEGISRA